MAAQCVSNHTYGIKQYGTTVCKVIKRMAFYDIGIIKYSSVVCTLCYYSLYQHSVQGHHAYGIIHIILFSNKVFEVTLCEAL